MPGGAFCGWIRGHDISTLRMRTETRKQEDMTSPILSEKSAVASLANAVFIGYMMGCHKMFGRRTQLMGNLIGESVGEEILKYAHAQGFDLDSLESVEGFLREHGMGGEISIAECGVCPKRVGHYQFDGTACPWPGLLAAVLLAAFRERLRPSARLVPAETCVIRLHGGDMKPVQLSSI